MIKKWNPVPVLLRISIRNQARVSAAISGARARVPHRGGGKGPVGGSLGPAAKSRKLIKRGKSHVSTTWSKLGQKLTFFVRGTTTQRARKVRLHPKRTDALREVEFDAAKHFTAQERRRGNKS